MSAAPPEDPRPSDPLTPGSPPPPASAGSLPSDPIVRPEGIDFEIPVPKAAQARRSTRLTAAAGVLLLTGVFDVVGFALVISTHDSTSTIQRGFVRGAALMLLALAALNLLAGLLVLRLQPNGRLLGLIVGSIGVLIGLVALASSPARGLPTLVLAGFVVWVLATEGPAFRPPDAG